jgi:hypothetical protein
MIRINNIAHPFGNIPNTTVGPIEKLNLNSIKTRGTMKDMSQILSETKVYIQAQRENHQRSVS